MVSLAIAPRIGKCLRLLASPEDGEKLAAIAALDRTLKAVALDFNDLATAAEDGLSKPTPPPSKPADQPMSDLDKALWIRDVEAGNLTGWTGLQIRLV